MRLLQSEVPVFVDAHGGSVCVPAGVSEQQVLKARQHLKHMADEKPSHPLSPDVSYHDVCYLYERRAVAHRRSFILLQAGRPASNQRRDQIQQITDRIQELNGKLGQRLQRETGVNV